MLSRRSATLSAVLFFTTSPGCSATDRAGEFQQLLPTACVSLAASKLKVTLSAEWKPYLAATRVCPLAKQRHAKASIWLVSIFIDDYYRDKPADAKWENFPRPLLLNVAGERVGELEALFPEESPGEMVLTYGRWQGSIPGEIKIHIIHPGVSGDYDLPTLRWNKKFGRYE